MYGRCCLGSSSGHCGPILVPPPPYTVQQVSTVVLSLVDENSALRSTYRVVVVAVSGRHDCDVVVNTTQCAEKL